LLILVLNPGGNSLKAEIIRCDDAQEHAFEADKLISLSIEGIGKKPILLRYCDKTIVSTESVDALDYECAAESLLAWLDNNQRRDEIPALSEIDFVGVRVVHGGPDLISPMQISPAVVNKIHELENLAPLHNKNSLALLKPLQHRLGDVPIYGVFDTAFHRTIPDHAALYPIPLDISKKHRIRRYGFHGISHRYMLERYASIAGKSPMQCNLITMHLESGCSVTAIRGGVSIDNTMGLTPLEGLMMGTRSGDIDPSIISVLVREEGLSLDKVMAMLNRESGLLGVSGVSLDTRVLMKKYRSHPRVKLAMDMFCYRVLKAVGSYMAVLGGADALILGGGIAENNTFLREYLGEALGWCGLQIDPDANQTLIDIEGRLSTPHSTIEAWVIPVEEGKQIAHECCQALASHPHGHTHGSIDHLESTVAI
jgi:acetate kinase